jgi:hypothetical protein
MGRGAGGLRKAGRRGRSRGLFVVTVLLAAGLAWSVGGTAQAAAAEAGSGLRIAVAGTVADPELVLTNGSSAACQVVESAQGSVEYAQVEQNGSAVNALAYDASFEDDLDWYLAAHMTTLSAGSSITVPLEEEQAGPYGPALEAVAYSQTSTSRDSFYPIKTDEPVKVTVTYAVPITAAGSVPACAATGALRATATLGASAASASNAKRPVLWIAVGVVLLLVIAVLLFWLLRRRRASKSAKVAAVLVLLACAVTHSAVSAPSASATITVTPSLASAYATCIAIFSAPGGDPAHILPTLENSGTHVSIQVPKPGRANGATENGDDPVPGWGSIVFWNPAEVPDYYLYPADAPVSPCASLYHELDHAYQDATGGQNQQYCWIAGPNGVLRNTGIRSNEVQATWAQNRLFLDLDLPLREYYGENKLPPFSTPCQNPPANPPSPPQCTGSGCGSSNGDPHLITFDGEYYDFQAAGEFVAALDPTDGFQVQTRQQPYPGSKTVALNTATAMDVAGVRVEIDSTTDGMSLLVGGVVAGGADVSLAHGGSVVASSTSVGELITVTWPDGSVVTASQIGRWGLHVTIKPAASHAGHLEGLLGNDNGNPADDVEARGSSTPITKPSFATLYPAFANSWRISQATSLFTYAAGSSTATYTDPSFPDGPATTANLPDLAQATTTCGQAGVSNPTMLQDCELDVGLTGQAAFATADAAGQPEQVAGALTANGPAVTADITVPGSTGRLHFEGTAGQQVFVELSHSTLPDQCGLAELDGPNGNDLGGACAVSGSGDFDPVVLPITGQYTVVIEPKDGATGSIEVRLITDVNQTGTITAGGPAVTATITQPGATSTFSFHGSPGQQVFVELSGSTLAAQCGQIALVAPNGDNISEGCIVDTDSFLDAATLTVSGTYTIQVAPKGSATGKLSIRLINDVDQTGTIAIGGAPVTATIGQPGATSSFTFQGGAGQKVSVAISGSTLTDGCDLVELDGPGGAKLANDGCVIGGSGSISSTALPTAGTYTLVVDPEGTDTGHLNLQLSSS